MDYPRDYLRRHRRIAIATLSAAFALAALWYVLRGFEWSAFVAAVRSLDARWIVVAVLFDVLSYVCQAERWRRLLRLVVPVSLLATTRAIYAGLFVNEVLPMRPGEVLRALILARDSGRPATALIPSMLAERLMDGMVLVAAALWTAVYVALPEPVSSYLRIGVLIVMAIAALLLLAGRKIPAAWSEPLRNWPALQVSILVFLAQCLAVWSALRACGLPISLPAGCAITAVLRIGTAVPMAPANIGTHQLALIFGLSLFGVSRAQATPVAFIVFALLTFPLLILGALAVASGHQSERWQVAPLHAERP